MSLGQYFISPLGKLSFDFDVGALNFDHPIFPTVSPAVVASHL
jgi:hypothetical protein